MALPYQIPFDKDDSYKVNQDSENSPPKKIKVFVEDSNNFRLQFSIRRTTPLGKLMNEYGKRMNLDIRDLRFLYEERRFYENHTAEDIDLPDNGIINVFTEMSGGTD